MTLDNGGGIAVNCSDPSLYGLLLILACGRGLGIGTGIGGLVFVTYCLGGGVGGIFLSPFLKELLLPD